MYVSASSLPRFRAPFGYFGLLRSCVTPLAMISVLSALSALSALAQSGGTRDHGVVRALGRGATAMLPSSREGAVAVNVLRRYASPDERVGC